MTIRFGNSSSGPATTSLPTASNPTTFNSSLIFFDFMNDFEFKRQQKAERFRELAEKHESISTGRHLCRAGTTRNDPTRPAYSGLAITPKKGTAHILKRIDQYFAKAKEHHDRAEYFRRRACAEPVDPLPSEAEMNSIRPDSLASLLLKGEAKNAVSRPFGATSRDFQEFPLSVVPLLDCGFPIFIAHQDSASVRFILFAFAPIT